MLSPAQKIIITILAGLFIFLITVLATYAKPTCAPLEKVEKQLHLKGVTRPLTEAEYHFLQGSYATAPPVGLPPGDGAVLFRPDHDIGYSIVIWTKGILACLPSPVANEVVDMLPKIIDIEGNM